MVHATSFSFIGTPTKEQFWLVQKLLLPWWGTMAMATLMAFAGALVFALVDYFFADASLFESLIGFGWAALILFYAWGLTTFARHRQWWRMKKAQLTIAGTIGADGLEWNTPMTKSILSWSKMVKIRRDPEMILFFYNAQCAFYIPKNFFTNEAAWNDMNDFVARQPDPSGSQSQHEH